MSDSQADGKKEASAGFTDLPEELVVSVPPNSEYSNPDHEAKQVKIFCHNCQQKLEVTGLLPFAHISCPACGTDLIVPKWFDNYLLEEPCGCGGMASVYRALDIALDREVAVKILNPQGPDSQDRFLNEARTAATINHSCVIPIYTCGMYEGQAYIVMQFMNGGSLEQKLLLSKGAALPVNNVIQWIHDTAEGLEYAANHGIVHHDVKPGNIMLDADGNAKIGDFGIAARKNSDELTLKTSSYGSPLYISPEKVSSGKEDSSGDIYSLGATFYHLLTGIPPFQHENLEELLWTRVKQNPVAPHQLRQGLSPLISSLIMRMMNHSPEMRPGYQEIIRILNATMHHNDTSTLIMRKEMPLPQGHGNSKSPNSTSSLRVKSPSVMLKRRRSSIVKIPPEAAEEVQLIKPDENTVKPPPQKTGEKKQPSRPQEKIGRLMIFLIVLAVIMTGFMVFSAVQMIQAFRSSPEIITASNQTSERR